MSDAELQQRLLNLQAQLAVAKTIPSASQAEVRNPTNPNQHIATVYQEMKPQANARLVGQVKRIVDSNMKSKTKFFYVYSNMSKREYHCMSDFFLPIEVDDCIDGMVYIDKTNPQTQVVRFMEDYRPFVELSFHRDAIVQVWIKILRGTGFGQSKANKLFDHFIKILSTPQEQAGDKRVNSFLSEISLAHNDNNDPKYVRMLTDGGLNETQSKRLLDNWYKKRELRRLYLLGFTNTDIKNICLPPDIIYKQCRENPYVLYQLKKEKADIIVKQLNLEISNDRVRCGQIVRYMHEKLMKNAWTCTPMRALYRAFPDFVSLQPLLEAEYKIHLDLNAGYLSYPFNIEVNLTKQLLRMMKRPDNIRLNDPHFKRDSLNAEQKLAIKNSLVKPVSIITGGAGTGKTTVIDEIIHNLDLLELTYLIVSFTGKAVARVKEVVGTLDKEDAATIHLTLTKGYPKSEGPMFIIIDEASMVTAALMYNLGKMFNFDFQLILVGDINQLPPIGWGAFFQQLNNCGEVPVGRLLFNHRSMLKNDIVNGIILNSERLIQYIKDDDEAGPDDWTEPFMFKETPNFKLIDGNVDVAYTIVRGMKNAGIRPDQITIICPYKRYLLELNSTCQQIFNDGNASVECSGITWMVGDRVMMRKNNYDIYVMNGEEGVITEVRDGDIKVKFNNGVEHYFLLLEEHESFDPYGTDNKDDIDEYNPKGNTLTVKFLCHCFAITVHRSQGSEWDYGILYMPGNVGNEGSSFLDYKLIYTAITRFRKAVWCIGNIALLNNAALNKGRQRYDNLARRIREKVETDASASYIPADEHETMLNQAENKASIADNDIGAW